MKKVIVLVMLCLVAVFSAVVMAKVPEPKPYGPTPSKAQLVWHEIETYCLPHFSMATYTNEEWAYGDKPLSTFNPTDFSAEQIVKAAKAGGLKGYIMVAKHHDGFCLWPTKTTEYSVKNCSWKDGKGDMVKEFADACRKHGLAFGLYCSPWDRNHPEYGKPGYVKVYHQQLRELWTNYGELFQVWFDGAVGGTGYYGGARENRKIDKKSYYDYSTIIEMLEELQPNTAMFSDVGPDLRWCGNESGWAGDPCWATYTPKYRGTQIPVKFDQKTGRFVDFPNGATNYNESVNGHRDGKFWMPSEADFPLRPGWFYHKSQDARVRSPQNLIKTYFMSVGRGASFNIGLAPDKRGRLHDNDVASLKKFGNWQKETFSQNLATDAKVIASNTRGNSLKFSGKNVLDGNKDTYWSTDDDVHTPELVLDLGKEIEFNVVSLREYLPLGQRIDDWALDTWQEGKWVEFAKGTAVGNRRLVRTNYMTASKVRLRITKAAASPAVREFTLYREPEWARRGPVTKDNPDLGISRKGWKIHDCSYEASNGGEASRAIDGNMKSLWHTYGTDGERGTPQYIAVDMGKEVQIEAFLCMPRRDGTKHSIVDQYEYHVSSDGKTWTKVAEGEFGNIVNNPVLQTVKLKKPVKARYFKFTATHCAGSVHLSISELGVQEKSSDSYKGKWVEGNGDIKRLELIDHAFESMQVSSQMNSLAMLYKRDWDGLAEGSDWPCWWEQNSFGPSYGMMPFLGEPYATWLKHSQAMWFRLMGDGKRKDANGFVGPDGCLVDAAGIHLHGGKDIGFGDTRGMGRDSKPMMDGKIQYEWVWYRQGDGNPSEHDWYLGGTTAGLILESERLLIKHDPIEARKRLPQLIRVAAFLDSRRDPDTNLIKGGNCSNLLAPSYGGYRNPDGGFGLAYLTELSVNYSAGLDRLAEVCDMVGNSGEARKYRQISAKIRAALPKLMNDNEYFIMSIDPDGARHGVYGAEKHGYFEATPNHDAVCMRVVDDTISKRIINRMTTIPELTPFKLVLPNSSSYDEISTAGIQSYGTWVNGGHWATTQGRMNVACMRVDEFDHPFTAWEKIRNLMQGFRAGAPMPGRGQRNWFNGDYNIVYDSWGAPGGILRGLFEYDYRADSLRIRPHIPSAITNYIQKQPAFFGKTKIYLTVTGTGKIKSATINGNACIIEDGWVNLNLDGKAGNMAVEIVRGDAKPRGARQPEQRKPLVIPNDPSIWVLAPNEINEFHVDMKKISLFYKEMIKSGLQDTYEAEMARVSLELLIARQERRMMRKAGTLVIPDLTPFPSCNQDAVGGIYFESARKIAGGLIDRLAGRSLWKETSDPRIIELAHKVKLFPPVRTAEYLSLNQHPIRIVADGF